MWSRVKHLIPQSKVVWEACMFNAHNSQSIQTWTEWGYKVVGSTEWDILTCEVPECDIIVTGNRYGNSSAVW